MLRANSSGEISRNADQAKCCRSGARFLSSSVVETFGKLTFCAGLGNDQSKLRWKGNRAHLLTSRVKENGVLRPAEDGRDLIEQTGAHPDEPMLGPLAKPRDFEWRKTRLKKLQEKKSRRNFERGGTG